jgi:D-amino peptidase
MKVFIMTDMEGVAGIIESADYCLPEGKYYEHGRELTTLEVNAAVEGLLEAGATDILVVDGHGHGGLHPTLLHPEARILTGRPRQYGAGMDSSFDAAIMIGQHAKANTDGGHLCHTGSFDRQEATVNGITIGEMGLNMLIAGYFNVPYIMLSGDKAACEEFLELCPNGVGVPVVEGLKRGSAAELTGDENRLFNVAAIHRPPRKARELIRQGAREAVERMRYVKFEPLKMDPPYEFIRLTRRYEDGSRKRAVATGTDMLEVFRKQPVYEEL